MKLLYLSDSILPSKKANSVHVMKMCEAFAKAGIEVTLVAARITDSLENIRTNYSIVPHFEIYGNRIISRFFLIINLIYSFKALIKYKPDVIYSRSIFSSLANLPFRKSLYLEIHKKPTDLNFLNKLAFNILIKLKSTKKIIVISRKLKELVIQEVNIDQKKILILHDGATIEDFNLKSVNFTLDNIDNKIKVGYVGTIGKGRGIELINELSTELIDDFRFFIVGGSKTDLINMGIKVPSSNLVCLGYMSFKEANSYTKQFDILLAPYNSDLKLSSGTNTIDYMSPLKIFEYMAHRKPIIVSDLPVIRDFLTEDTVVFANSKVKSEWVNKLNGLRDVKVREEIGSNAFNLLKNEYTWDVRVQRILNCINL